jgi:Dolichyl-phosphate-mannose-protein mannosyltransferase
MIPQKARAPLLAALAIGGIFLAFAGDGIRAYFTPDDMMNLYVSWSTAPAQLLHNDRPLGTLVYRVLFALFGLNPMPYRIVCFGLLLANLGLLYRFCVRLSGSREAAALACLLAAYHGHLADLYYSTGTIYDLLCCLFFLLAFNFYLEIRETGYPSRRQTAGLLALYGCALASKEMAVVLPLYVLLFEWIFHRTEWRRAAGLPLLWIAIPLTVLYAARKVAGPHAMAANPDYTPHITLHAFVTAWKWYLHDLFYGAVAFSAIKVVLLWLLLAAFAAIVRRREVWFACCVLMLGVLPFIFIAPRGFFVMYLVLPGWYLFGASVLMGLVRQLPRCADWMAIRPEQLALFAVMALLLVPMHRAEKPLGMGWVAGAHQQVRTVLGQLEERFPTMPPGSKVLFLSDPYDADDWILTSMFRLEYRDRDLRVDRVKVNPALASKAGEYAHVFELGAGGLRIVR